jgi:hypothetical protein
MHHIPVTFRRLNFDNTLEKEPFAPTLSPEPTLEPTPKPSRKPASQEAKPTRLLPTGQCITARKFLLHCFIFHITHYTGIRSSCDPYPSLLFVDHGTYHFLSLLKCIMFW